MQVYFSKITDFEDLKGVELLTVDRRAQFDRYSYLSDKAKCLVAGLLLRRAFGSRVNEIKISNKGKPYFENNDAFFNLSHSGDMVVLAVDADEVGIDIEQIRLVNKRVAERCYTRDELDYLYSKSDLSEFYKLWTAKESLLKAIGSGFTVSPASFSVLPKENGLHTLLGDDWYLTWYNFDDYECCLCSKTPEKVTPIYIDREELLK